MTTILNKEDEDYKLVFKEDSQFYSVKLLKGKYTDVIFTYGKVQIKEPTEDGSLPINFNWKLEEKPDTLEEILEESTEFQHYIGDILADLIQESAKAKDAGKHTDDNTKDTGTK
tara:strand:- start:21560 stop:21901 length:342 start_codon:yes stop_codon:yes gene_type:complete